MVWLKGGVLFFVLFFRYFLFWASGFFWCGCREVLFCAIFVLFLGVVSHTKLCLFFLLESTDRQGTYSSAHVLAIIHYGVPLFKATFHRSGPN